jgi:hypothetical protein
VIFTLMCSHGRVFLKKKLILVPTELSKEEARWWAAVLAISGVFAGVVLISLATAAEDIPV